MAAAIASASHSSGFIVFRWMVWLVFRAMVFCSCLIVLGGLSVRMIDLFLFASTRWTVFSTLYSLCGLIVKLRWWVWMACSFSVSMILLFVIGTFLTQT